MSFTSKLCNPTPFPVDLNWTAAISIQVEPFGSTDLTMQQMDDFRPGKPGSAEVKSVLDYYGVFLYDSDRPYDNQALEALKRSHKARKAQYDAAYKRMIDNRAAAGVTPNVEATEETLSQMGYEKFNSEIGILAAAIKKFEVAVKGLDAKTARQQLDPKRTIFILDPPREFPSVAAMEFFLDQHPTTKAKHRAFLARGNEVQKVEEVEKPAASIAEFFDDKSSDGITDAPVVVSPVGGEFNG